MTGDFEYLIQCFGKPADAEAFTEEEAGALKGRLPDSLLEFWCEAGIGIWCDGLFQFCRPLIFSNLAREIFANDKDFVTDDVCIYGFTAFAKLLGWHSVKGSLEIDLLFSAVRTNVPISDREQQTHSR